MGLLVWSSVCAQRGAVPATGHNVAAPPWRQAESDGSPAPAREAFARAIRLMRTKQFRQAAQLLEAIPDPQQQYPGLLLNLGIAYGQLGQYGRAETALRKFLQTQPNHAVAYNQLGIVHRKRGRFRQAREAYERALGLRPNYRLAHFNLGILCDLYLQRAECALHHYREYQKLSTVDDPAVVLWIEDLQRRAAPR